MTCDQMVTYCRGVDAVFKALADPTRRDLLDALFAEDGQTLTRTRRAAPDDRGSAR